MPTKRDAAPKPQATKFNPDRAAAILVDALFMGDKAAAQRSGVTAQSIRNWRRRLDDDEAFLGIFALKKEAAEGEWASSLAPAIRSGIEFLSRAAREASAKDPEVIHAIAGALKILTTTATRKEIIDVQLARLGGSAGTGGHAPVGDAERPSTRLN